MRLPDALNRLTASTLPLSPTPEPPYVPIRKVAGGAPPNQAVTKLLTVVLIVLSMRIADWPGAMLPTPRIGTDSATSFELSSMVQPVMSTAAEPTLVTSNQSAK